MKGYGFMLLCFFLGTNFCIGQRIEGLKKMDMDYIHLFTSFDDQEASTISELELDLQRIKNIPGIGRADLMFDSISQDYVFTIKEVTTLLPIVNFGGITDNYWYKLGLSDYNLFGQGKNVSIHYQNNNGRHSGQLYYRDPYLIGNRWGYSLDLNTWSSEEPLFFEEGIVNYDFNYKNIGGSVIRNFGIHRMLELGANYFVESYEKSERQPLEMPPGPVSLIQPKLLINTSYESNFVDYHFFFLSGSHWKATMQNVYNLDEKDLFHILQLQYKNYIKFGKIGNLAMRLRFALSTNNYSPFAPFVIDSYVNIRGVGNRIDRGTGQAIFNIEYRHTLLSRYPFGIQVVVFSDLGSWRNPGGELSELVDIESVRHFVGGGFRFVYQQIFGATFRIDYGVDIYDLSQRGFVIGLGQYF
ncbi:BamA/TamA family outer membrane protein [Portibacter lacus]|nr:BamA/TamA family outer membrane protein [Portibacter lacus]